MGQSHVKRRERERPLRRHRAPVARELQTVCTDLGLDPPPSERRKLIDEVVWLANPSAFRGIDAPIPAGRTDLMRAWFFHRLVGTVETTSDVERMARHLAPAPDDDFCPGSRWFGDPTSDAVRSAHASQHRRQARREVIRDE